MTPSLFKIITSVKSGIEWYGRESVPHRDPVRTTKELATEPRCLDGPGVPLDLLRLQQLPGPDSFPGHFAASDYQEVNGPPPKD